MVDEKIQFNTQFPELAPGKLTICDKRKESGMCTQPQYCQCDVKSHCLSKSLVRYKIREAKRDFRVNFDGDFNNAIEIVLDFLEEELGL